MKKLFSVQTVILAASLLLQLNSICFHARGAAGDVDLSFDPGTGINGSVSAIVLQPDGKVIIGGAFSRVRGVLRQNIARLNADGSGDSSFLCDLTNGFSAVGALALQADGKVLAASNGQLFRLNSDGQVDPTFATPNVISGSISTPIQALALQPDGKILIGGAFNGVNGTLRNRIARLNGNGSLDLSFVPETSDNFYAGVFAIAWQSDGKVIIGGQSMTVNNDAIARLNTDGSLDVSFNASTDEDVRSVAIQPDGKVLMGGFFNNVNGTARGGVARLNSDGSLDGSFNPGAGATGWVFAIAPQSDGKVLIGRYSLSAVATTLVRLNANGSLDNTFDAGPAPHPSIFAIAVQPDGKVLAAGPDLVGSTIADYDLLIRHNPDGSRDSSFVAGGGIEGPVWTHVVQPDGRVVIGGEFRVVDGEVHEGIARLHADGSVDSTFTPSLGIRAAVMKIAMQSDGRMLVGGRANDNQGQIYPLLTRLHSDGSADTSFTFPSGGVIGDTGVISVQPDGKVIVGGLSRLNADGSLDSTFNPDLPFSSIYSSAVQPDGKILIGGMVCRIVESNGVSVSECHGLVRLNPDGSLDSGFQQEPGADVRNIVLQPDGKAIITGNFGVVHGVPRPEIARLNADGSLDTTFNPAIVSYPDPTPGVVHAGGAVLLQPDGRMLVAGSYYLGEGIISPSLFRLNVDGSLDNSFDAHSGVYVDIRSMSFQAVGRLVLTGGSMTFNGIYRQNAARLHGDSVAPSLSIARFNAFVIVSWPSAATGFVLQQSTNLNAANWTTPSETITDNGTTKSISVSPAPGDRFFRLIRP
jgi:uncharacterized delta-60 repeat protein